MINSASIAPIQGAQHGQMSSIMPMNNSVVVIDGKQYPVITVPNNKPGACSFAPMYKQVVIIDGKQYPVQSVQDNFACDKTKDVVVVDGKQYDVQNQSVNGLGGIGGIGGIGEIGGILGNIGTFNFNPNARVNEDATISYMA